MSYYTPERFNNWIERIREVPIDFDRPETLEVFDKMMDDFVVACLNVIRAVKERELTKKQALEELENMENILTSDVNFEDAEKNDFFDFVREGLKVVARSAKYCIEGKVSKKKFESLLKEALKKEKSGDVEGAFDIVARMGAKVFKGEKLPDELPVPEDSLLINWIDGIDAINTVMLLMEIDSSVEE